MWPVGGADQIEILENRHAVLVVVSVGGLEGDQLPGRPGKRESRLGEDA